LSKSRRITENGALLIIGIFTILLWVVLNILITINPIYLAITVALLLSMVIYGRIRIRRSKRRPRQVVPVPQFLAIMALLAIPLYFIIEILALFWIVIIFIAVIVLGVFTYLWFRKYKKKKLITSEINDHLLKALKTMDTTYKWYNKEEEANRELVSCLKSQGVEAIYQYRLPNGRTADAKVGNVLIEGKLSPDTGEVDRLIGQLSDYIKFGKVSIVIYGALSKEAKRRIESEILQPRYLNKISLTYLSKSTRQRAISLDTKF